MPKTSNEAYKRATNALYAIKRMSSMMIDQLDEDQEDSDKTPTQYWTDIATDIESRFQGNINSLVLHKLSQQCRLAMRESEDRILAQIKLITTDSDFGYIIDGLQYESNRIQYLRDILDELKMPPNHS